MIDAILTNTVLPAISRELLNRMADGTEVTSIGVDVKDDEFVFDIK